MRRAAPRLIATLALALLLAACPGPGSDPVQTSIAFFDASATSVERGDPVTLSWQVDNPGTAPDQDPPVFPCSITRRPENGDPENFEVACTGALEEIPPAPATSNLIRYQLNALKRPFDAASPYITQTITINLGQPATGDTAIARFEADATNIERGDPVTLSWQVDNPGTAPGVASCRLTRQAENEPAEEPFPVACTSTLNDTPSVPVTSSSISYRLDALKNPPDAVDPYLTSIVTIDIEDTTYATRAGGTSTDVAWAVSTLDDGSAIVAGYFSGTSTFGDTTITSAGSNDAFFARINPNGTWAWATHAGGTNADRGYGVSALPDGSTIVTGYFAGIAKFGDIALTSVGSTDAFVARIDADGTWAWATPAGGANADVARRVAALSDGGAIVTGYFEGAATFGGTTLTSAGGQDVFVARIDSTGSWVWAIDAGGTDSDTALGVSVLGNGSAVVAGFFNGSATFGGTTLTSAGGSDVFVARVAPNGTWAWAAQAGGGTTDEAWDVTALADGSAIVTGTFAGTAAFDGIDITSVGSGDVFVARIDPNGTWTWAARGGGSSFDIAWGVSAFDDGSAVIAGFFEGTASFGASSFTSAGSGDVFAARINANGTWAWASRAGGLEIDEALGGVAALADGTALVTGYFYGTASFGTTSLASVGSNDIFVAKIDALGAW